MDKYVESEAVELQGRSIPDLTKEIAKAYYEKQAARILLYELEVELFRQRVKPWIGWHLDEDIAKGVKINSGMF